MRKLWIFFILGIVFFNPFVVLADTVTDDFNGTTAPSSVHIAKYGADTGTAWDSASSECSNVGGSNTTNYANLYSSDDDRLYYYSGFGDYNHSYKFEMNVSKICSDNSIDLSDVTNLRIGVEGYTHGGSGSFYLGLYNDDTASWVSSNNADVTGTWLHNEGGDSELRVDIADNIDDYLIDTNNGYIKFVAMCSGVGYVGYVDYVYITLTYNPLSTPVLSSPTTGQTLNTTSPTLSWSAVTGATQYYYQVGNSDFSVLSHDSNTSSTSITVTGLTEGTKYWRVRAGDGSNYSAWSSSNFNIVVAGTIGGGGYIPVPQVDQNGVTINTDSDRGNLLFLNALSMYGVDIPIWSFFVGLIAIAYLKKQRNLALLMLLILIFLLIYGTRLTMLEGI
jgi:hypothetical protein